jgi:hypothetical protein
MTDPESDPKKRDEEIQESDEDEENDEDDEDDYEPGSGQYQYNDENSDDSA